MNYLLLANGFEEIEAITVMDILRRANIDLKLVSTTNYSQVISDRGLKVIADMNIRDINKDTIESIILPGGGGTSNLETDEVHELLQFAHNNNKNIFAICAAPSILGKLNILEGKKATCYPGFEKHLKGAKLSKDKVCIDGNIITSRGPGTAHDFAYSIVEKLKNKQTKQKLQDGMLFK